MGRRKPVGAVREPPSPQPAPPADHPAPLSSQSLDILLKEYDALRELYSQAESSVQNIFNFYLTLVSAVGGAVIVIWQVARPDPDSVRTAQLITAGLLLFVAIVGSVYLSAITGRYAHMDRYARGIDQLRRFLLRHAGDSLPAAYQAFMARPQPARRSGAAHAVGILMWFTPTGTYQLFVGAVNSLGLAAAVWLFLSAAAITLQAPARSILTCVVIALVSYVLYNIYSRYVKNRLVARLNVQVDSNGEAPFVTD